MTSAAPTQTPVTAAVLRSTWVHVVLIMLAGSAVYANSLNVPFVLDDHYTISYLGSREPADLLLHGGARRFADLTFTLNFRMSGLQVTGYHLTNLLIHLASALTLYALVASSLAALRSCSSLAAETPAEEPFFTERFMPLATALLFVVHPVQTQAVTYLIQRYTSLASFFYLLSALAFIKTRLWYDRQGWAGRTWVWSGLSLLAALAAFGTKQITYTLPCMLLLLEICLFGGRLLNRRFLISCGAALLLIPALGWFLWHSGTLDELLFDLRQASSESSFTSRSGYFLTQLRVMVTYLRLLCLPIDQRLLYDYPAYGSILSFPVLASAALHAFLLTVAVTLLRTSRTALSTSAPSRAYCQRMAALGIFWFYLALSVESSFIPIRDVINEHRLYLPSAGFFMALVALAALAVRERRAAAGKAWVVMALVCLLLGGMTIARNRVWSDALLLWQDNAAKAPNNPLVLGNLANEYMQRRMPERALPLFVRAIEIMPHLLFRTQLGLGDALKEMGMFGQRFSTGHELVLSGGTMGIGQVDIRRMPEWVATINNNMGLAYEYLGEPAKAMRAYDFAVSADPSYALAWLNMGLLAVQLNDATHLEKAFMRLRTLEPQLADILASQITR